jgi:hypothetical protein
MKNKEVTYPIKSCPCCGYSAEAKYCYGPGCEGWYIQCTKCHIRTIPVYIDSPYMGPDGKPREDTRYDYYGALKVVTDTWNHRATVEVSK